jgi:hypothetical protein
MDLQQRTCSGREDFLVVLLLVVTKELPMRMDRQRQGRRRTAAALGLCD